MLITGFATGPAGVNCYLVASGPGAKALVIDPGDECVQTLDYYFGANDLTPAAVLLTHGAAAHAACAGDLALGWEIPVYVHPSDRARLSELGDDAPEDVVDFTEEALHLAGIEVTVTPTPGHTEGSVILRVEADTDEGPEPVVFAGDTLAAQSCGATEDPVCRRRSVHEKLLVLDDHTVVLPGHGPSTSVGVLRRLYLPEE